MTRIYSIILCVVFLTISCSESGNSKKESLPDVDAEITVDNDDFPDSNVDFDSKSDGEVEDSGQNDESESADYDFIYDNENDSDLAADNETIITDADIDEIIPDLEMIDADSGDLDVLKDSDVEADNDNDSEILTDNDLIVSDEESLDKVDFSQPGKESVSSKEKEFAGASCNMKYDIYTPVNKINAPSIIISHGFARSKKQFANTAAHLSSYGFTVYAPNACSVTDHQKVGEDLAKLAEFIGGKIVFVGHSAGGLRSLIAGSIYSQTSAVFGLDLVDKDEAGVKVASNFNKPLYGVFGEPSSCNSESNGTAVYQAAIDSRLIKIVDANHCSFENPSDNICLSMCKNEPSGFSEEILTKRILGFTTAFILWHSAINEKGEEYWNEFGSIYNEMLDSGAIVPVL